MPEEFLRDIQWKRLLWSLGFALMAVILLTPLCSVLGAPARKSSHFLLIFSFLGAQAYLGKKAGTLGSDSGWSPMSQGWRAWWRGYLFGIAILAAYSLILLYFDERSLRSIKSTSKFVIDVIKYIPLSFVIGVLEDVLFFGFLFATFGRRMAPCVVIYAVTHFLHIDKQSPFGDEVWFHGFDALAKMSHGLWGMVERPMDLIGLTTVGFALCQIRVAAGQTWTSMGVHGGWYYVRTIGRKFSRDVDGNYEWLLGTDKFYDGLLGCLVLLLTAYLVTRSFNNQKAKGGEAAA